MRNWIAMMLLVATSVTVIGCSGDKSGETASSTTTGTSTTGSGGGGKKLTIAVIPKGSTHEYWKSVKEGADKAGVEFNADIKFQGPEKEDDRNDQQQVMENVIIGGVDGIVLAPLDDKALVPSVKDANKAKIPVVIMDSAITGGDTVSYVATDNEKAGGMAGDQMVKLLNGKGSIIVLRYAEGSASTTEREKGFLDAVAKAPGIKVLSKDQFAGATVESAQKASENLLAQFKKPDGSLNVDGIYCPNESSTFGMLLVLEDEKNAGKVKFMGFDSSDKLLEGVTAGYIDGLIVQNPKKMGYLSVKTVIDSIHGKKVDARIDTGATLITKANMGTPENKELLAAPKS